MDSAVSMAGGAIDISIPSLIFCFLLLIFPLVIALIFKVKIIKSAAISILRMTVQLLLIGFFLKYLFEWDNQLLNVGWLLVMVLFATFSVIRTSRMNLKLLLGPSFISFLIATTLVLLYFNGVVVGLSKLFTAKYLIAIGGMLLGNSLRGNITGISNFYQDLKRNESRYLYQLACGATQVEAILPYFKKNLSAALGPMIARMATMGVVSLPGMMTGQMLGGSSPLVAVKYQIAIMIAIFVSMSLSTAIALLLTLKVSFSEGGILKKAVFRK